MQNIVDIGSLITQGKILKTADIDPNNDYAILQKWRAGNRKRGAGIEAYESFAIPLSELLGGGSAYFGDGTTITLGPGNIFSFTSMNISQFTNDSGYLTATTVVNTAWALNGNTVGAEKFLGTIDNFALPIRTNNVEVARFDTAGNLGIGINTPTAKLHAKGIDATNANFVMKLEDVANTLLVYVRNDGAFSTKYGVWIDGIKKMWTDNTFLHTVFWNHSNASPLTTGSSRNTLVGNSDSNQPQLTSGGFNSVFGTFSGMNISTGSFNLVLGNYNLVTPGAGSRNINMGQGGMSNAAADETLTVNGFSENSNEAVFGSEVYARYSNWWFGQGKELNNASGRFNMNWNATSSLTGQTDSNAMITEWVFNASRGTGTGTGGDFVWKVAPAGATGSALNPLVVALRVRQTGGIAAPLLQTGNAGLVTGDLYVDTAANILANGDVVVGRKV